MTFNWTRALLLPLLAVGIEMAWVSAWLSLLAMAFGGPNYKALMAPPTVAIMMLWAWLIRKVLLFYKVNLAWTRRVMTSIGIIGCILASKAEHYPQFGWLDDRWIIDLLGRIPDGMLSAPFAAMAVAAYLWWRGECLARSRYDVDDVHNRFRIGLVAMAVCLILMPLLARDSRLGLVQAELSPLVFIFAISSLLALSLTRLESVRQTVVTSDPTVAAFHRQWVASIFAAILGLWVIALAAAHILDFDLGRWLAGPLGLLGKLLDLVITIIMYPVSLLVELFVFLIRLLIGVGRQFQWEGPPGSLKPEELPEPEQLLQVPAEVGEILKWGMAFLVAAVVVYLLWWAVARPVWLSRRSDIGEDRDSVWSWNEFRLEVLSGLRRLTARLGRRPADEEFLSLAEAAPEVRSLREMYRWLLRAGATADVPRPPQATPFEYAPMVGEALAGPEEVRTLTAAYVQARYSDRPPASSLVEAARQAWERLRQEAEERRRQKQQEEDSRL